MPAVVVVCVAWAGAGIPAALAQAVIGGTSFAVREFVGMCRLPASLRNAHGETFGSIPGRLLAAARSMNVGVRPPEKVSGQQPGRS